MSKTAMMQLKAKLDRVTASTIDKDIVLMLIDELLSTEKQQIDDAFNEGYKQGFSDGKDYGKSLQTTYNSEQ
jgi:hypothetical protein